MGSATEVKPKSGVLLEVDLPVCDQCHRVGMLPVYSAGGATLQTFCMGPAGASHRKVKMRSRPFREVRGNGD